MGIRHFATCSLAALCTLSAAAVAQTAPPAMTVNISAGPLAKSLTELSIKTGIGLLFSPTSVEHVRGRRLTGRMSVEEALAFLLADTGLTFRRTAVATYVIEAAPEAPPEPPIPEILVVGHRTQNSDIRRTENDIQPYRVFSSDDVASSQVDNPDQFLRTRLTNGSALLGPTRDPANQFASNRSEINLNGLGANQTLVLVDGARMPSVPYIAGAAILDQPDLNGIPLSAVERIETLTATAGGIYGPGAIGGIVNMVLKRDYRGADLAVTYGVSSRGDAPRRRVDARFGFTPDGGRTNATISVSRTDTTGLEAGSRDYALTLRNWQYAQNPASLALSPPRANAVRVQNLGAGGPLSLKPAFGGARLGATFTYLPVDRPAGADIGAALVANAGKLPETLSDDASGARRNLTSDTHVTSILANVRHEFSDRVEAFVDLVGYQNDGRANAGDARAQYVILGSAPTNPFQQTLLVSFPSSVLDGDTYTHLRTYRASGGFIVSLTSAWKINANYAFGGVDLQTGTTGTVLAAAAGTALTRGQPVAAGGPILNPFGDWAGFVSALEPNRVATAQPRKATSSFRDASVRAAGNLFTVPAGPIALTILGERRTEAAGDPENRLIIGSQELSATGSGFSQTVTSAYGELRAPIVPRAKAGLLRGLEVQLALRFDHSRSDIPLSAIPGQSTDRVSANQQALAYTAGMRFYPRENLMVRASASTGTVPPSAFQQIGADRSLSVGVFPDPKRPGRRVGGEGTLVFRSDGSRDLKAERGQTLGIGLVLNPDARTLPRFSIDYTHVRKSNEIVIDYGGDLAYFLANEAIYADRIIRAPLTAADRAAGFSGGVVTRIDASYLNVGRTRSDTVDFSADYSFTVERIGRFRLHGIATWQPRLSRQMTTIRPEVNYVGFADGPLAWRANGGVDWRNDSASISLNGQFYSGYHALNRADYLDSVQIGSGVLDQYGVRIPPQFYLDLAVSYRLRLAGSLLNAMTFRLGVQNLLDHKPPLATNTELGYSYLGDPRRQRFELSAAAHF